MSNNNPDGRHLAFPFRIGADGQTAQVADMAQHVKEELIQLLLTSPGERAFLPEFGGGLRRLVFEGAGDATAALAKATISRNLSRWLGTRVTVDELTVETAGSTLTVNLTYRVAGSDERRAVRFQREG